MKLKIISQVVLLLLLVVGAAEAANTLTVIGRHPFNTPPLTSVDEFRDMVQMKQSEVELGFEKAGHPGLYQPFMDQLPTAEITQVDYQSGETFHWMFYKTNGKGEVKIGKDITWGGAEPLAGYEFYVDSEGQRYTFAVPLVCGNIALKDVSAAPVVPVAAPAPVAPEETPAAIVPVEEPPAEKEASPFRFVADAGYLHQFDPANYAFARVGFEHKLNEQFSYLVMLGGAPRVRGSDGESAALVDVIGQFNCTSRMFLGLGLGGWITSGDDSLDAEDTDVDLIFNVGARVYGEPEAFNTSLFFEARSAVDEMDDFSEFGRVGVGLRFRF